MRKKYIGITSELSLINGKVYETLGMSYDWHRIIAESGFIESTPTNYIRDNLVVDIANVETLTS